MRNVVRIAWVVMVLLTAPGIARAMDGIPHNGDNAVTPEPSSVLLLGTGIAMGGFAWLRSRRKKP